MSLPTPEPLNKKKSKNCIPANELLSWVEENVDTDGANIIKIRDHYLWSRGDVERHRVDVFERYEVEGEGEFCWTNKVGERSYFLHYHKAEKTITDRTTGRYVEKDKGFKLSGISKGSERIGKSFR
jgi:hypothetical protein|tara:strand:- start:193 stop:570 length:378 start_codon:yes stop_codon:yes gene_type:complete